MAYIREFGCYLPERVVTNAEIAAQVGIEEEWIRSASGIEERRYARENESVRDMGVAAARDCLERAGVAASRIGMLIVASGTAERRFPGPAASVAQALGLNSTPALDMPIASAGSLWGMALAAQMAPVYGDVLVVAAEKMSSAIERSDRNTTMLFGDGAGACLVSHASGRARIIDFVLASDGSFAEDLRLDLSGGLKMNGMTVIMQAARKIPRAIQELLARNNRTADSVDVFLMHQANLNLMRKVSRSLGVAEEKFYSNIQRYGNTSSASMLIAAAEWSRHAAFGSACFATFGAGFHWGALLAEA